MYRLASQAQVSPNGLRALSIAGDLAIVGSNREAIFYNLASRDSRSVYLSHNIYSVVHLAAGDIFAAAGTQDGHLNFFEAQTLNALPFKAHQKTINSIILFKGQLVTGSWDGSFKVWVSPAKVLFEGVFHGLQLILPTIKPIEVKASKFGVELGVFEDILVACGVDGEITLWNQAILKTFKGHDAAIRAVRTVPGIGFLTAANDQKVKVWTSQGEMIEEFAGHSSFIFGAAVKQLGSYFSCGEDRTLRAWENKQVILHPNTVWSVGLWKDDVVSICADGFLRVFTKDAGRQATEDQQEKFRSLSQMQTASSVGLSAEQLNKLPAVALTETMKGKTDKEIKLFNDNGKAVAYCWSAEGYWQLVGDVVGQGATGGKTNYKGDQYFAAGDYDHVVDVELQGVNYPLPLNRSDDYGEVAEKFCKRQGLSKAYIQQIKSWLQAQVPGGKPKQEKAIESKEPTLMSGLFPNYELVEFVSINAEGMGKKLQQLNEEIEPSLRFTVSELYHLKKQQALKLEQFVTTKLDSGVVDLVTRLLQQWPHSARLPVWDLLRMWSLHFQGEAIFAALNAGSPLILQLVENFKTSKTVMNLSLKTLCNIFASSSGKFSMLKNAAYVLGALAEMDKTALEEQTVVAVSSLIKNYSVAIVERGGSEQTFSLMARVIKSLKEANQFGSSEGRLLASVGNLVIRHPERRAAFFFIKDYMPLQATQLHKEVLRLLS